LKGVWPTLGSTLTAEQLEARLESYATYGLEAALDAKAYLAEYDTKLTWWVMPATKSDIRIAGGEVIVGSEEK
jgi:hypothetical protein